MFYWFLVFGLFCTLLCIGYFTPWGPWRFALRAIVVMIAAAFLIMIWIFVWQAIPKGVLRTLMFP